MAVASWVSPITTAVGTALMLALLGILMVREMARQRGANDGGPGPWRLGQHGPPRAPRSGRLAIVLGALLTADVIFRFGILTRGR